ncbi:polysulfide reductase NrfD [Maribacter polysiphoniae]|uniref:Formate-dependent nitrite reductase membrane component NrfD n=1 Tax=Maribacter polysiphoniae TaxID=429344 RepID=A0A316EB96_9FLAO|nr:NrfD/PsrC family molybdoenzyme membrane anchor subunit [Maribacter polysiphoniae]MBD1262872.1 polysulfide reductase NrfD [Maribacter polysiphoniae]PWK20190.1 formate-dependent nitrite reductase membrane component NrfD [Maribacter polysiphoniae]
MEEELFTSGRNLPNIDPSLQIWHWPISVYLFLGGLAAGLLFFAAVFTVIKKEEETPATVKYAVMIAPIALVLGLLALFYDLTHKIYFWQLYTTVRIESPMSWGAWVLLIITPLSMLWVFSYWKEVFPKMDLKFGFLKKFQAFVVKNRMNMAYVLIPLSVVLGIYTGILLSAFNARPLWNNAILGPLFLVSGLSTAAATIILFSKSKSERSLFSKIDIALIVIELALIVHMIMGYWAGSEVQLEAMQLLTNGEFTVMFFVFVVILGLLLPGLLEILELKGYKVPVVVPAILILIGGLVFRFVMVEAGQLTRYLY